MRLQNDKNIKNLLESVPNGFFVDSKWLTSQGISRQLVTKYVKSGWLVRAAHGLYQRPLQLAGDRAAPTDWELIVLSMQRLMDLPVHLGGVTALQRQGHSHYATMGSNSRVFLYAVKWPGWIASVETNATFELRNRKLFKNSDTDVEAKEAPGNSSFAPWNWSLSMSSPERAILEALDELPDSESFDNLDMIFQGLVNLRPRRLMRLMNECTSIQVKRLFFVFADKHDHAWRKHLNHDQINLGSGDRSFVKGGKLHPKYRITVPSNFIPQTMEGTDEH
jgi:hypothetical protein